MTAYVKDPKKVTAGRASAAARKKNHQAFLDKTRDAKHVMLAGAPEHVGTTAGSIVGTTAGNMRQLIIMGVVGGGCASTHTCSIGATSGSYEGNAIEGREARGYATFAALLIR